MTGKLTGIAVFLIALMVTVVVVAAVVYILTISSTGTIGQYGLTADPSTIEWGTVVLNLPVTRKVDITNTGTKDVVSLNLTWGNPVNLIVYDVTWDCEGVALQVGYVVTASITLTVTDAQLGPFSLDLFINDNVP